MFTSINERSRKPDRYQPIFFSFFRTRTIRSKSLENLHDRQQQQQQQLRKEGKRLSFNGLSRRLLNLTFHQALVIISFSSV